ncbi:unnamed protein product [Boreogadus saida]
MDRTQEQVSMEESELLKERIQAITDKRRVQEDIAKKRRLIEEEKLQLQYIKKKALREQWLMDGLSPQTGEDLEAQRLQAQGEQEQTVQLQSNIDRIEKEIEDLETHELNISANEEVILKRLKEVERTAEDIIKELNAGFNEGKGLIPPTPVTLSDPLPTVSPPPRTRTPQREVDDGESKRATFVMEISVEHDPRTGESHVVAMSTITPDDAQEKGVKVYDDGRKSVYALNHAHQKSETEGPEEMTQSEVDELLSQAMDKEVPSEVQYHQPVYSKSTSYQSNSRPSTPRTPSKTPRQTPTPTARSPSTCPAQDGAQSLVEGGLDRRRVGSKGPCSPVPSQLPREGAQSCEEIAQQCSSYIPNQAQAQESQPRSHKPKLLSGQAGSPGPNAVTLVSVTARSEGVPIQPVYRGDDRSGPHTQSGLRTPDAVTDHRGSPCYQESEASLNDFTEITEDFEEEPVTMIFMGFKNAEEAKDEEEDFQAELVMICNSDEEEDDEDHGFKRDQEEDGSGSLSYHPQGYSSKVFCPRVGVAKVSGDLPLNEGICTNCEDILPLKPTFIHKPGKNGSCLDRQQQPTSTWKR